MKWDVRPLSSSLLSRVAGRLVVRRLTVGVVSGAGWIFDADFHRFFLAGPSHGFCACPSK